MKEKFSKLVERANSSDGIILSVGIGALILGILVDVFIVRLVCLLVVGGAAVLLAAILRVKHFDGADARQAGRHKRLIFDDVDAHADHDRDAPPGSHSVESEFRIVPQPAFEHETLAPEAPPVFAPAGEKPGNPPADYTVSDFFDVDSAIYKGDAEPKTEFDFLLNKVLTVIKDAVFAHTVAFFWANREKGQMVLEARVTEASGFMASRRYTMGHDLVTKVAVNGKPELVTHVNPTSERELIAYYERPASVKSFIGVPVFFSTVSSSQQVHQPVAVIAVDSKVEDQFGPETLALLGQYTKLVSALIKSYTEKYDLLIDSELLRSIRRMQERIRSSFSVNTILQSLAEETSKLINWDLLSVVLYDERKHAWLAKKVAQRIQEGSLPTEQIIDFPRSIVGETIQHNSHQLIDDLEGCRLPRYYAGEHLPLRGSFVAVPVSSLNKCYGALILESRARFNFSRHDVEMLYRLAENAASALEILYLKEVIDEYVIIDDVTGTYSKKFFNERLGEELQRADERADDLSILVVAIDRTDDIISRYTKEGFERVMTALAKVVRASVRPYDIIGRLDDHTFGIMLIDTAASDAYLWAEKIRKSIAAHVINLDRRCFSITISTGVCGGLEGMKKEELLGSAITVLNKACESGGNAVRVF